MAEMVYSHHLVVWMFKIHVPPEIVVILKSQITTLEVKFFSEMQPAHMQTVAEAGSCILTVYFRGVSPSEYAECGIMAPGTCSLINSVAAFQHEKEPSELNISLHDLQSNRSALH